MLAVAMAAMLQASSQAPAAGPTEWLRRPSAEDLARYYPHKAKLAGVEGSAVLECRVAADGSMTDCRVLREDPVDYGFGEAALGMSRFFSLHSSSSGPAAGGDKVRLPLRFTLPSPQAAAATPQAWIVPDWLSRATAEDLARVYPARAVRRGIEGIVMVVCRAAADGTLRDCYVEQEAPQGAGLGDAALKLTTKFLMRPQTRGGRPVEGGVVRLPLQFRLAR